MGIHYDYKSTRGTSYEKRGESTYRTRRAKRSNGNKSSEEKMMHDRQI